MIHCKHIRYLLYKKYNSDKDYHDGSVLSHSTIMLTIWLATANRSCVSICDGPCTIFLTSSLVTMKNSFAVSHTMCAHVQGLNSAAEAGAPPHWNGAWLTPWKHVSASHVTKFRCSESNRVGVGRVQKCCGCCGPGIGMGCG